MIDCQQLPPGLEDMPPGPELAAVLAGLDRSRLDGFDMVVVLRAQARQVAHEQARLYADMAQVAKCVEQQAQGLPGSSTSKMGEYAADEIRAALSWTRRAADAQLSLAWLLTERLPAVWAALDAGLIDVPKAKAFGEETLGLEEADARQVCGQLLDQAPGLTTGQLRARLAKLVIEVDPAAAKQRQEQSLAARKIVCGSNREGTAYLSGCDLAPERAVAAFERVDALARALKRAGDTRPIDAIRADVYLDLLDGTCTGPAPQFRRGVVEVAVELTTLMGLNDRPGQLAGYGPVIADIARQVATEQQSAQWRYIVTDPVTGQLLYDGITRRRPTAAQTRHVEARDRTCRGPGCRAPATRSDKDHTWDHAKGGATTTPNLGGLCDHDHDLKHEGGWTLTQPEPGHFEWTSALGHTYLIKPDPITSPQPPPVRPPRPGPGQRLRSRAFPLNRPPPFELGA